MSNYVNIDFADNTRLMINLNAIEAASFEDQEKDIVSVGIFCTTGNFPDLLFSKEDANNLGVMIHNRDHCSPLACLTELSPPGKPSEE